MKTTILSTIVLTAALLSSCGNSEKETATDSQTPIQVNTKAPAASSGNNLGVSGEVVAVNNATLSTRMMGFVNRVHVTIGDKVSQGQLLISINNSDLQAKRAQVNAGINEAQVAFNNAKRDFERFTALFAQNSASQKELDDMTANYEMAKARLESAKAMKAEVDAQFAYTNITAPFSGVVTNRFIEAGAMANPGMPLLAIEAPGNFEVRATVPEGTISHIKSGATVTVHINAIEKTISGKVTEVSSSSSTTGGQYPIKVVLEKNDALKSGMYATVQFPVTQNENTPQLVTVPQEAIVTQGDLRGVYTLSQQGTAMLRWLRLGRNFGNEVEVLSGLNAEEAIIVEAEGKLYNGAKVEVQN
ncbi:efflux RND transporter periplasmic adaptor subunit [Arenibacter sp. GZD96]|uniref:efflux RND transporter periplasmic adaptor subunit n=1 Tax=Aurantibrevibacter litoralis TaxID=3106030 RepID=UPI002AFE6431|nr:efflux RND transporter periplasmic adaptor subunit [Arenibacter sp. GZD-96]MEA1787442.1 efflux RND transporter periplasmic adaptor subunit [Arenibacter sp. GZD-96]